MAKFTHTPDSTVKQINRNFVIRYKEDGDRRFSLIGGGRYHYLVGQELADKHFHKVLNGRMQSYTIKLRRGLTIQFASK